MDNEAIFKEAEALLLAEAPRLGLRAGTGAIPWSMLIDLAIKLIMGCVNPTPTAAANPTIVARIGGRFIARKMFPGATPREIGQALDTVFAAGAKATQEKMDTFAQAAAMVA